MEVAVTAFFVAAEDDYGSVAGGQVVEEVLGMGKMLRSRAEVAAEQRGRP